MKQVYHDWPKQTEHRDVLIADLAKGQTEFERLTEELNRAKAYHKKREKHQQLRAAQKKKQELDTARKTPESKKSINPNQLEKLVSLETALGRLEASLSAGALKLKIDAATPLDIQVQSDLKKKTDRTILPDEPVILQAGGRIALRHSDWSISVESGEADFQALEQRHQKIGEDFKKLLESLKVDSVEQARTFHEEFNKASQDVERHSKT